MGPNNDLKRQRSDSDNEQTDNDHSYNNTAFARFLIIESLNQEKTIASLSPFIIEKTLQGTIGTPKSVKKLRTGNLLVEVDRPQQSSNLKQLSSFFNIPCKCYPHRSLNTSRGIIRCPDLAGVSDEEIVEGLSDQHVTAARRIKIKRDNKEIKTNTIVLTFGISILPKTIKVGYLITKVEVYIPNPLQCYSCFKFGHFESDCSLKGLTLCQWCGGCGESHPEDSCRYRKQCVNCKEEHSAKSRTCKVWQLEKEVLRVKFTQNLSYPDARKIALAKFSSPSSNSSYAAITKSTSSKSVQCVDAGTQTGPEESNAPLPPPVPAPLPSSNPKPVQNIPNYKPKNSTSSSVRVNQSPRTKIDLGTDRVKKGSENPILQHNRYKMLEEMEDEDEDFSSDPPKNPREKRITKLTSPDSMQR